ncbi:hypothetical protein BN982_00168 [Halobacillus karajensis]|nr:hypothetical protein BN982_00168 [Halobacillus karajensis]
MVSWSCEVCSGKGKEQVVIIRSGKVTEQEETCQNCRGSGAMRNGKPEYVHVRWD